MGEQTNVPAGVPDVPGMPDDDVTPAGPTRPPYEDDEIGRSLEDMDGAAGDDFPDPATQAPTAALPPTADEEEAALQAYRASLEGEAVPVEAEAAPVEAPEAPQEAVAAPEAAEPAGEPAEPEKATEDAPAPKAGRKPTTYLVLQQRDGDDGWREFGRTEGQGQKAPVLRAFVEALPPEQQEGRFRAVAESSWKGGLRAKPPTGPVFEPED